MLWDAEVAQSAPLPDRRRGLAGGCAARGNSPRSRSLKMLVRLRLVAFAASFKDIKVGTCDMRHSGIGVASVQIAHNDPSNR